MMTPLPGMLMEATGVAPAGQVPDFGQDRMTTPKQRNCALFPAGASD